MSPKNLTAAVDWFFTEGYKELAHNPSAPTQSLVSSAFLRLKKVSDLLEVSPSDALLMTYEGKMNGKLKK